MHVYNNINFRYNWSHIIDYIYIDPDCDSSVNHEDLSKLTAAEENMEKNDIDGARNASDCQG